MNAWDRNSPPPPASIHKTVYVLASGRHYEISFGFGTPMFRCRRCSRVLKQPSCRCSGGRISGDAVGSGTISRSNNRYTKPRRSTT